MSCKRLYACSFSPNSVLSWDMVRISIYYDIIWMIYDIHYIETILAPYFISLNYRISKLFYGFDFVNKRWRWIYNFNKKQALNVTLISFQERFLIGKIKIVICWIQTTFIQHYRWHRSNLHENGFTIQIERSVVCWGKTKPICYRLSNTAHVYG